MRWPQTIRRLQQERTNKTLSEKLDQTAGVICPPDIDPAIKAPTPNAGNTPVIPPPGSPVAIRPSSPSDPAIAERPAMLDTAVGW